MLKIVFKGINTLAYLASKKSFSIDTFTAVKGSLPGDSSKMIGLWLSESAKEAFRSNWGTFEERNTTRSCSLRLVHTRDMDLAILRSDAISIETLLSFQIATAGDSDKRAMFYHLCKDHFRIDGLVSWNFIWYFPSQYEMIPATGSVIQKEWSTGKLLSGIGLLRCFSNPLLHLAIPTIPDKT